RYSRFEQMFDTSCPTRPPAPPDGQFTATAPPPSVGSGRRQGVYDMRKARFETVAEAQRRARKRLPKSVYSALLAGSELGISYDDNVAAFAELGFAPHVADL